MDPILISILLFLMFVLNNQYETNRLLRKMIERDKEKYGEIDPDNGGFTTLNSYIFKYLAQYITGN